MKKEFLKVLRLVAIGNIFLIFLSLVFLLNYFQNKWFENIGTRDFEIGLWRYKKTPAIQFPRDNTTNEIIYLKEFKPLAVLFQTPSKTQGIDSFLVFMKSFYSAYKTNNWKMMFNLAEETKKHEYYFSKLITAAEALAKPNLRDAHADWSSGDFLTSLDNVKVAISLLAAKKKIQNLNNVELTKFQRLSIEKVWLQLYKTVLIKLGTTDEIPPTNFNEPQEKIIFAVEICQLLNDFELGYYSIQCAAWLAERIGDYQYSIKLRKEVSSSGRGRLPWPPIIKKNGQYIIYNPIEKVGR